MADSAMHFWTEIYWSEGMFLRPHHLQAGQRWAETVSRAGLEAAVPFPWGFLNLEVAREPLENHTFRLEQCTLRMKDGTWVCVPENTEVEPLNFQAALEQQPAGVDILFGLPDLQKRQPNTLSLEDPASTPGILRYKPHPLTLRDENTGGNPQTIYCRRMRGKLFTAGQNTGGYATLRVARVVRTDRPGAIPEMDSTSIGPLLSIQADAGLSKLLTGLADQVETQDERLAQEAREHRMMFTDGVAANTAHLLKLNTLNEGRALLRAMLQSPVLHPFDVYVTLARLIGRLSVFHDDLVPGAAPQYDHDHPGAALEPMARRLELLLEAVRPFRYVERRFGRKQDGRGRDGLEVELDRRWIEDNLEIFVGFTSEEHADARELMQFMHSRFDLKLASPSKAPEIEKVAVSGLDFQVRPVPPGSLPLHRGLHYFKIDKAIGPDRTDYWRRCEQERGIRMSLKEGQLAAMEKLNPTLYVILKER